MQQNINNQSCLSPTDEVPRRTEEAREDRDGVDADQHDADVTGR